MKTLFKMTIALIIILVGAALVVPFLIPLETYKKEAITRISDMTGRDISIDGDMRFRLLPNIAIVLEDVTVGNPKSGTFKAPYLAKIQQLNVGVALAPLMNKNVSITQFELVDPDIHLEQRGKNNNWSFDSAKKPTNQAQSPVETAANKEETPAASGTEGSQGMKLQSLSLSKLAISNGQLSHSNNGVKQSISDISLSSDSIALDAPTALKGELTTQGQTIRFDTEIASLQSIMDKQSSKATIRIEAPVATLNFSGTISQSSASGSLEASSSSLIKAAESFGTNMQWKGPSMPLDMKGAISCTKTQCKLSDSTIRVDNMPLTANLTIGFAGKSSISGQLSAINVNTLPYFTALMASNAPAELWLVANAHAAQPRWSQAPISLAALSAVNLDLDFKAKSLMLPRVTMRDLHVKPKIQNGAATVTIVKSNMLDGSANGTISATPRGNGLAVSAALNFAGVNMEKFLQAAIKDSGISGTTNVTTNLRASGNSVAGLVDTLSGSGKFSVTDGAIKGVNLGQMARNVKSAFSGSGGNESTDFAALTASFSANNGVLSNQDLSLKAPFLRMSGQGQVNLPAYTINYRLLPELVETSKGQGGKDKVGIKVPVLVTGSLNKPRFAPDLKSLLENPEQIKENISAVKDRIKDEKANFKENKAEIKQQFKDLKKDIKQDPAKLLQDPNKAAEQLNNLLKGF